MIITIAISCRYKPDSRPQVGVKSVQVETIFYTSFTFPSLLVGKENVTW